MQQNWCRFEILRRLFRTILSIVQVEHVANVAEKSRRCTRFYSIATHSIKLLVNLIFMKNEFD